MSKEITHLRIRLPVSLRDAIGYAAKRERRSMQSLIQVTLEEIFEPSSKEKAPDADTSEAPVHKFGDK